MKNTPFIITLILLLSSTFSFAQDKKPDSSTQQEKPVIVRDRLMIDIFHTFWLGVPTEVNYDQEAGKHKGKFNPGFTISGMWDFKLPKKVPISFGLGLGVSYYTQYSNSLLLQDEASGVMKYNVIPSSVNYKRCKLAYTNFNIPFEIRYRHSNGFKVSVGVRAGLAIPISQRYKGDDPDGSGKAVNRKSFEIYNRQKYSIDVYMRMGWKYFGAYFSYQLNKVFTNDKGPQMAPMSVGISISLF